MATLERPCTILGLSFAKWRGSDGRALGQAFRSLGHNLIEIDEEDYDPWRWQGTTSKVIRRLLRSFWINDYNRAVAAQAESSSYDFALVFKGSLLQENTVKLLQSRGKPVFNFYPDVSFHDHGQRIPAALRWYDCVFTTKQFHGKREIDEHRIRKLEHVRHGFDPEVHRPVVVSPESEMNYGADVSFVGCWSPEKEDKLLYLVRQLPDVSVKIFGLGWKYASAELKQRMKDNLRPGAFGDELSMIYCSSKINLGLLSCSVSDPLLCDQTTARTFQIPAARGFMLHEDTAEVRTYFEDGKEVMLFGDKVEMVERIDFALKNPALRETISENGYRRCRSVPYDYTSAAETILRYFGARTAHEPVKVRLTGEAVSA